MPTTSRWKHPAAEHLPAQPAYARALPCARPHPQPLSPRSPPQHLNLSHNDIVSLSPDMGWLPLDTLELDGNPRLRVPQRVRELGRRWGLFSLAPHAWAMGERRCERSGQAHQAVVVAAGARPGPEVGPGRFGSESLVAFGFGLPVCSG